MPSALNWSCGGGKIVKLDSVAAPIGTSVSVLDLFYNTPARRKFMKSPTTEMSHITDALLKLAMANPDVGFRLKHGEKQIFDLPPSDFSTRIAKIVGHDIYTKMLPIDFSSEKVVIKGFAASPDVHLNTSRNIYVFVNGRFVRDRMLTRAVYDCYRHLIPSGRYPFVVVFVQISPDMVDVNVHPQKYEVRFSEPAIVHGAVVSAISKALHKEGIPQAAKPAGKKFLGSAPAIDSTTLNLPLKNKQPPKSEDEVKGDWHYIQPSRTPDSSPKKERSEEAAKATSTPTSENEVNPAGTRVLGSVGAKYIVCETSEGVMLVDQHAAHEMTIFDELKKNYEKQGILRQPLLFPQVMTLDSAVFQAVVREIDELQRLGFWVEEFGSREIVVKEIPAVLVGKNFTSALSDIFTAMAERRHGKDKTEIAYDILARTACHAAVRTGDTLTMQEMEALVEKLMQHDALKRCPHGRPVALTISWDELDKWFRRK